MRECDETFTRNSTTDDTESSHQSESPVEDLLQSETSTEKSFPSKGPSHQNKEAVILQCEAVRESPAQREAVPEPPHLDDSTTIYLGT